jgi:hypothetical protein
MGRSRTPLAGTSNPSPGARRSTRCPKPRPPGGPERKVVPKRCPKPHQSRPKYVRHKSELAYIKPDWSDEEYLKHFKSHAFDVPPRSSNTADPWVRIKTANGRTIVIPQAYRLPLLIAACNQWSCFLESISDGPTDWATHKNDHLHWSRLCNAFLNQAQEATNAGTLDRDWRCPMFDRVLTRLHLHWFSVREEWVIKFWKLWGEEIYEEDPLREGRCTLACSTISQILVTLVIL